MANCITRIELSLSCQNIPNMDTFSKSDPLAVVYQTNSDGSHPQELGRTECIKDTLNPKFVTKIPIDYRFETNQHLKFVVYDVDKDYKDLTHQDLIGEARCLLSKIVTSTQQTLVMNLQRPGKQAHGTITIISEEIHNSNTVVTLQFSASNLDKKDLFGKSDPFFVISRSLESGKWDPVFKSVYIDKTLNPSWGEFTVSMQTLCNGDPQRTLLCEIFDWNKSGKHEIIGSCQFSLQDLSMSVGKSWNVVNETKRQKKKSYTNSGILNLQKCQIVKEHSFLEYISGGCQIGLVVAIDFTGSNGDPRDPSSLHYNNPTGPNQYQSALLSTGEVLCHYDADNNYPTYGFGAIVPPSHIPSHCWPLNGNWSNPEVHGIKGLLDVYQQTLNHVNLYGPTNFAEIIKQAKRIATSQSNTQSQQNYTILLICTDGEISDIDNTIDEIVGAANTVPLSIIIVGIGNADFVNMKRLDADENPLLDRRGVRATRDIVQFVPLNQITSQQNLASELLAEIPKQMVDFYKMKGIAPNPSRIGIQHQETLSNMNPYTAQMSAAGAAALKY